MKAGKIPAERLERLVLNKLGLRRQEVLVHAGIGEDSAVVDLEGDLLVISSDPITGADQHTGYLAVNVACNDLAAAGAEPMGIQIVLLLPTSISDREIGELMTEIDRSARQINVEIMGGHTEVLSAVEKPIITITAIGRVKPGCFVTSAGAKAGDDLILTKGVGVEGTYILASDYSQLLLENGVSADIIATARDYGKKLSVIREGRIAAGYGVNAMHDVTEGGLYGALEEVARAAGLGFKLDLDHLPVSQETEAICHALSLDPAGLISSGSMLIAVGDGEDLIERLADEGISSTRIGTMLPQGRFVQKEGRRRPFHWAQKDELWRFLEQHNI